MAASTSQGMPNPVGAGVRRDVVLVEVPVVDVDLELVVVGDAEALERLEVGPRGHRERGLDPCLVLVVGEVEPLRDRIDRVGHRDRLAVVPVATRSTWSSRR